MQLDEATARLVSASLIRLRTQAPFFGTLSFFTQIECTQELATAGTDGRDIFLNPTFFQSLSPSQQDGLLLHEVLHAALLHVTRCGSRERSLWNLAADIVINGMIEKVNGFELPPGGVRAPNYEELSVEEVYELLLRDHTRFVDFASNDLLSKPPADQSGDRPTDRRPLDPGWQSQLEAHWRHAIQQATMVAHSRGKGSVPTGLARELDATAPAQIDWRTYLWRYLVQTPTDFSQFDRRFVGQGLYLEILTGESVHLFVAVDTSGSVKSKELGVFLSEVQGIVQIYPHLSGYLYYTDSAVYGPHSLMAEITLPKPVGGGGTDFCPFFELVRNEQNNWQNSVCIYLTDGFGVFPEKAPDLPVLWVVPAGGLDVKAFPFGEAIRLLASD